MRAYKIVNGTSYDNRTPDRVMRVLEDARLNHMRLHISLGNTETGRDWLEEFESHGYIGRSTGSIKVPLLLANRSSTGGGALLDHCIVRIRESAGGRVIYQHRTYHHGTLEVRPKAEPINLSDGRVLTVDVLRDGELHAAFEDMTQARRWFRKMGLAAQIAT